MYMIPTEATLEDILDRDNLNNAYRRVKANQGAPGIDGMSIEEALGYLKEHKQVLLNQLYKGEYKPQPVRRVEIPKPDGGVRKLGIPTVIDRIIQQAIVQVIQYDIDCSFHPNSYGFRPMKSAHQALEQAKSYYEQGYKYVVDIDLAKYFDTVNHDILLNQLRQVIKDQRIIKLIKKYLKSGVMEDGLKTATEAGTPQGGNLSPLLSNIYLNEFDWMLTARGHRFVRYADDCNIYVKSKKAAQRVMKSCVEYLEGKLKLKVNQEKSQIGSPLKLKFLGFALYKTGKKVGIRVHEKSLKRFKAKIRELTSRKQGKSLGEILQRLKSYTIGWLGYYSQADMGKHIKSQNEWIRRRLRQICWKQWKRIKSKYDNLKKLGVKEGKAWEWANSRKGYWRIAGSFILTCTLTNKRLAAMGYDDIAQRYEALHARY